MLEHGQSYYRIPLLIPSPAAPLRSEGEGDPAPSTCALVIWPVLVLSADFIFLPFSFNIPMAPEARSVCPFTVAAVEN